MQQFQNISIGDLFTGISILVSAIGIVVSHLYDRHKRRQEERARALTIAMQSLMSVFEDGLNLAERIKWASALKESFPSKEIVDFGYHLQNKIETLTCGPFSVWSNKRERRLLTQLADYAGVWNERFAKSLAENGDPITLDEFLSQIKTDIGALSQSIRSTIG